MQEIHALKFASSWVFVRYKQATLRIVAAREWSVVVHTGKLQPVLLWREKTVLLALPSNLAIPIPASYPVFRTKWREIS